MCLDEEPWSADEAWRKFCFEHDEIKMILQNGVLGDSGMLRKIWAPLPKEFVKVNTDGSFLDQLSVMGAAAVLRDEAGKWI